MKPKRLRSWCVATAVALGLTVHSGCQTQQPETLMTLPSPDYLKHYPQYIPRTPPFPLPLEQAHMEQAAIAPPAGAPRFIPPPPAGGGPLLP